MSTLLASSQFHASDTYPLMPHAVTFITISTVKTAVNIMLRTKSAAAVCTAHCSPAAAALARRAESNIIAMVPMTISAMMHRSK